MTKYRSIESSRRRYAKRIVKCKEKKQRLIEKLQKKKDFVSKKRLFWMKLGISNVDFWIRKYQFYIWWGVPMSRGSSR